jgi:anti-anti-sigma regulatory factor
LFGYTDQEDYKRVLTYDLEHNEGRSHLAFSGKIDRESSRELKRLLTNCSDETRRLELNLNKVDHISFQCIEIFTDFIDEWECIGNEIVISAEGGKYFVLDDSGVHPEWLD